jgi:S-formylglutathione hydrolase FrmB
MKATNFMAGKANQANHSKDHSLPLLPFQALPQVDQGDKNMTTYTRWKLLNFIVVLAGLAGGSALAADPATPPAYVEVAGARIVSQSQLTARTLELTIATPSFGANTVVEVTLPTGYDADPHKSWPVTYYLAGTNRDHTAFRAIYNGENLTASYPSIIVSPNADAGMWSDWRNLGAGGPPMYESFVSAQLIPLIDANFRTIANRSHRAVMGESMGGYGAMMMAARHPDLFVAAASLSGAVDTSFTQNAPVTNVLRLLTVALATPIYGLWPAEELRWHGHNPTDLAGNLRDVQLQVRVGTGSLSMSHGESITDVSGCVLESAGIVPETISFHNTLGTLAIPHAWQQYSWGCHSPALFGQEISDSIPGFVAAFGAPAPSEFDYRSMEPAFSVYGWSISADPARALEFLALNGVSKQGLTIAGSGATRVTTPPLFTPSRPVSVLIVGFATTVMATPAGQVTFTVQLGTANTGQQYRLGSTTNVTSATVTLSQD